jgi:hypothetical protein
MAKDPLLPNAPGEGDSWESLASNLLGINLNKSLHAQTVSAEELEALELEVDDVLPEQPLPPSPSVPDAPSVRDTAGDEEPDDELEDEPQMIAAATDSPRTEPDRASDPYWDPLAEWEWDDEPSKRPARREPAPAAHKPEPRPERKLPAVAKSDVDSVVKGPGADARRAAESVETVSDYRDEYESDDWEFGAGLLEGIAPPKPPKRQPAETEAGFRPPPESPAPSPSVPDAPSVRDTAEDRRERDKRTELRERPGRSAETKREERDPAVPPKVAPQPTPSAADDEDAFGAGLIEPKAPSEGIAAGEETQEERRSRRRRRRRPSKGEPRTGAVESTDAVKPVDGPVDDVPSDDVAADFDDDEEAADDSREDSPYRNIPSWEEAIGYLINPRGSAESSGGTRSPERGESGSRSESGRGSGGRRRRRRPSR